MRLCVGTLLKTISLCLNKGIMERELVKSMIEAVDPDSNYSICSDNNSEATINFVARLLRCENNPGKLNGQEPLNFWELSRKARVANLGDVSRRFAQVVELIDRGKRTGLVSTLCYIIKSDTAIDVEKSTNFKISIGKSKTEFLSQDVKLIENNIDDFLIRLFLYTLDLCENKIGRGCSRKNSECPVTVAIDIAVKNHKQDNNEMASAIMTCCKECVLSITPDYISGFSRSSPNSESNSVRGSNELPLETEFDRAIRYYVLGDKSNANQKYEDAIRYYKIALELFEKEVGTESKYVTSTNQKIAVALRNQGGR